MTKELSNGDINTSPDNQNYWMLPGYQDYWTEEDMRDATLASMRYLDKIDPYDDSEAEMFLEQHPKLTINE
jgi:hypothetical protein